jgi:hypothetical protein
MKTSIVFLPLILVIMLMTACVGLTDYVTGDNAITPSNTIITEQRDVSGYTGIDMSTFGKVVISQGDSESLTIKGSDNIVPLVKTSVKNGVLTISTDKNIVVTGLNSDNVLTFTITVKDLTGLTLSGAAEVTMDALSTRDLSMVMSGAGQIKLGDLTGESLDVNLSGVGNVEVAGEVTTAKIDISGAGGVIAPDLKIQTAEITISGIGGAELWVTDELTGTISGGGNVSYYGDPQTNTTTTGVGNFEPLGSK